MARTREIYNQNGADRWKIAAQEDARTTDAMDCWIGSEEERVSSNQLCYRCGKGACSNGLVWCESCLREYAERVVKCHGGWEAKRTLDMIRRAGILVKPETLKALTAKADVTTTRRGRRSLG